MASAQATAVLRGGNVVAFTDGMSDQESEDILDCLMYAEIQADERKYSHDAWFAWINNYQGGLLKSGLPISGVLDSNTRSISHHRELPYVASGLIQSYGHQELGDMAKSALETLLSSRQAVTFFQSWFSKGLKEKFQVVPCRRVSSGHIEIMVCGLQLITESTQGSWFQRPASSMTINIDGGAFLYDPQAFGAVRDKLRARLDKHAAQYFESLRVHRLTS